MITPNLTNSAFNILIKTEEALKPFVFNFVYTLLDKYSIQRVAHEIKWGILGRF